MVMVIMDMDGVWNVFVDGNMDLLVDGDVLHDWNMDLLGVMMMVVVWGHMDDNMFTAGDKEKSH